ncbi:MAG: hypothetical protein Q9183_003487 [Haloplaca sp. 2 TL-2023]
MPDLPESHYYVQSIVEDLRAQTQSRTSTAAATTVLLILLAYQLLHWLDYPLLSMSELLFNSAVRATPSRVLSALESTLVPDTTEEARNDAERSASEIHAQKSRSLRRILGLDGDGVLSKFQRARGGNAASVFLPSKINTNPPGLGNWDNSCYQNSVIQGLASLPSFSAFLERSWTGEAPTMSTKAALGDIITKLKDQGNLGTMFWTPAKLKSMSSFQQQDAQEYFSKLMGEVEREAVQSHGEKSKDQGLASAQTASALSKNPSPTTTETDCAEPPSLKDDDRTLSQLPDELRSMIAKNPLEGLLAQRVGCLRCGYVEGLSLIPFNCLMLPLGKQWLYDIRSCLDEYTTLEPIPGVDCAKCTLVQSKSQLENLQKQLSGNAPLISRALRASVEERLRAVTEALEIEDFSDNTVSKTCQIPQKSKVSSTKTRQAVIARMPESLAIHINRSVFDEVTGALRKNYANVRFPLRFDLRSWCLGGGEDLEQWNTNPSESMLPEDSLEGLGLSKGVFELRAALTHYGRHENGHYVCYRKHEIRPTADVEESGEGSGRRWWRFSDEDVSPVSEDDVLAQGDVFMLFYERIDDSGPPSSNEPAPTEEPIHDTADAPTNHHRSDGADIDVRDNDHVEMPQAEPVVREMDKTAEMAPSTVVGDELPGQDPDNSKGETTENAANSSALEQASKPSEETHPNPLKTEPIEPTHEQTSIGKTPAIDAPPTSSSPATINDLPLHSTTDTEIETGTGPMAESTSQTTPKKNETRNISHPMRTATPRGSRSSSSRGNNGIGQVSSMVTAN